MSIIKMSWNIISPYNILAIRARYKPISAWRSITNRYYLPQPFLNMTENEYKKKSFARFWHWTICWRIKIFSKNTSAELNLKHTLHLNLLLDKLFSWILSFSFSIVNKSVSSNYVLCKKIFTRMCYKKNITTQLLHMLY